MFNTKMMSSMRLDWRTPKAFYDELNKEFNFDFDPCPTNPTFDGLTIEWGSCNYVNPPYGREIPKWIKKGHEEWKKNKTVVFLVPSRTDTVWFQDYLLGNAELRFIRGRLKFDDHKNSAPFPSCVAILKANDNVNFRGEFK